MLKARQLRKSKGREERERPHGLDTERGRRLDSLPTTYYPTRLGGSDFRKKAPIRRRRRLTAPLLRQSPFAISAVCRGANDL